MVTAIQTSNNPPANDGAVGPIPFVALHNVTWQTYQALLCDLGEHRSARLAYDRGTLEIKMPSKLPELINRLLERIITTVTEELGMSVLPLGSTTFDCETSLTFPVLSVEILGRLIERGRQSKNHNLLIQELRNWLRMLAPKM